MSRFGEPLIDHVERVARAVPAEARGLAYLHDVLERSQAPTEALRQLELSDEERSILELLTRRPGQSYRDYVNRIARAPGNRGRIARVIKLADLDDHLRHRKAGSRTPDYAWARQQIVRAQPETERTRPWARDAPGGEAGKADGPAARWGSRSGYPQRPDERMASADS